MQPGEPAPSLRFQDIKSAALEQNLANVGADAAIGAAIVESTHSKSCRSKWPSQALFERFASMRSGGTPLPSIKSQCRSGRCWIFAALQCVTINMQRRYQLHPDFELSAAYIFYYNTLERAQTTLERFDALRAERSVAHDRFLQMLCATPIEDGGQLCFFNEIVAKYGLCARCCYAGSLHQENTVDLNKAACDLCREGLLAIDEVHRSGECRDTKQIRTRAIKRRTLEALQRALDAMLGRPPTEVTATGIRAARDGSPLSWEADAVWTPQQFATTVCGISGETYVNLVHDPRHAYDAMYRVAYLTNLWNSPDYTYLNVDIADVLSLVAKLVRAGFPVWFGCDVGKCFCRDTGILSTELLCHKSLFSGGPRLTKADRLVMGESVSTHAMTIVDVVENADGRPDAFLVANSWGEETGHKGYIYMTADWAREFMFQICVPVDALDHQPALRESLRHACTRQPVDLAPWDPMGTLARSGRA